MKFHEFNLFDSATIRSLNIPKVRGLCYFWKNVFRQTIASRKSHFPFRKNDWTFLVRSPFEFSYLPHVRTWIQYKRDECCDRFYQHYPSSFLLKLPIPLMDWWTFDTFFSHLLYLWESTRHFLGHQTQCDNFDHSYFYPSFLSGSIIKSQKYQYSSVYSDLRFTCFIFWNWSF